MVSEIFHSHNFSYLNARNKTLFSVLNSVQIKV